MAFPSDAVLMSWIYFFHLSLCGGTDMESKQQYLTCLDGLRGAERLLWLFFGTILILRLSMDIRSQIYSRCHIHLDGAWWICFL